ncbi:MAG: asparaginase [Anaerolineales bacterium]|nr:asparaginase [Anaerolineales bacterium]
MSYQPILECTRGGIVESTHDGIITVATADGSLLANYGDANQLTYIRSSAKPFQALPVLESGAADHYALSAEELAIICSSHSGTDEHVRVLEALQVRLGISESDLQTGVHIPYDRTTAQRLTAAGKMPTPNHHNCSGKHTGMLVLARHLGIPSGGYTNLNHPVQQLSLQAVAALCGLFPDDVHVGIDGCSVPTFAVPISAAASGYARLMTDGWGGGTRGSALMRIRTAMTTFPFLVAGPNRFDTALMEATQGRLLAKGGAEGFQAIGIPAGNLGQDMPALGVAIKVRDGDIGQRAIASVAMAVLSDLSALTGAEEARLAGYAPSALTNHAGLVVGEKRPCFKLAWRS